MKKTVVVMGGKGQVGRALVSILKAKYRVQVLDIRVTPKSSRCDYLHVAIPFGPKFIQDVKSAVAFFGPKMTFIHSTVPVGTTRAIGEGVVHSPVRGQHNDLRGALLRFVKYVGCEAWERKEALEHLKPCGFKVHFFRSSEESELAKLLCLSRYMSDLSFYEVADDLCKFYKVSPASIQHWTTTYNKGYRGTKWVRPDLDFPRGVVGGHCVGPVSKMLAEQTKHPWLVKNIEVFEKE